MEEKLPAVATLELKKLFSTEFHAYSLVLCIRVAFFFQMKTLAGRDVFGQKLPGVTGGAFLWTDNQVRR